MSQSFFRVNKGITLEPQLGSSSDPSPGKNGDIYYNDALGKFRKFENGSWTDLGGGTANNSRAANAAIANGTTTLIVTFSSPLPTSNYVVVAEMMNVTDVNPQYQQVIITNKTMSGFTAQWNAPTDSINYSLSYMIPGNATTIADVAVPLGATALTVTLSIPFSSSLYSIVAMLENTVDGSPQFQPVVVTAQTPTTFTVRWNDPTDSANYVISYQATTFA